MNEFFERTIQFFIQNTPSLPVILIGGPIAFSWALFCLVFAGYLHKKLSWRTGYTRKVFHFLIFFSVAAAQVLWGTPAVCLLGGMASCVVFLALFMGSGTFLYEALAREKDKPRQTHYILVPYLTTLLGGLIGNILFGPVAAVGYLVTGLGDAVGEPVGVRFGRHKYRVPSLTSVRAVRSLEGSFAVFIMSWFALVLGLFALPDLSLSSHSLLLLPALALLCALAEAVSPHGWDNLSMQLLPTALVSFLY